MQFQSHGIYAINGPNWDRDLKTICKNFGMATCAHYSTFVNGSQGQAVESEIYWQMNANINRFQEKIDDQDWLDGKEVTDLVDLGNIKQVPIAMFIGTNDHTCPHDTALAHIPLIQSETTVIDVVGKNHTYFATQANDDWFMKNLIAQLQIPNNHESTFTTNFTQ